MILQLSFVIVLFVVLFTLHLSHFHVMHQQWVVLKTTEADMMASVLDIIFLVLDLNA